MTTGMFSEQEVHFADEIAFCEQLQTFTTRIPAIAFRAPNPQSGRATDMSLQSRLAESRPGYQMPRSGGSFEIDVYFCGANADTASGALSATWLQKLLADGLGGGDLTQVGGVAGASATTTTMPNATGTGLRGGIRRVGVAGDGRGNGQAYVSTNPTTTLLTAFDIAPTAGDVLRACQMVYPKETLGATKRFLVGWNQTDMQYVFHGCQLAGLTVRVVLGDLCLLTLTYNYAYWREITGFTIPSAVTEENCNAAISSGGSYFRQTLATATRAVVANTDMQLTLNLALSPLRGQGGLALQPITGWVRDAQKPFGTLRLVLPYDVAEGVAYDADGSDTTEKHFLATLSSGGGTAASEGRHVSFYAPRMYPMGSRPAFTDFNGLRYTEVTYGLREGTDTTNDLTRSAIRFGIS